VLFDADAREDAPGVATDQFRQVCQKVAEIHERLPELEDAPAEFTLLRSCAGVYILHIYLQIHIQRRQINT